MQSRCLEPDAGTAGDYFLVGAATGSGADRPAGADSDGNFPRIWVTKTFLYTAMPYSKDVIAEIVSLSANGTGVGPPERG